MQATEREAEAGAAGPEPPPPPPAPAPPAPPPFDLFRLVTRRRRLSLYLEPLRDAARAARALLRWQQPLCSLLACLGLNFLLLTLSRAAWYGVCAALVALPAALGYLQETCRVRRPPRELARRKHHSVRRQDLPQAPLSRSEAIAEVKTFLIQLEAFLSHVCGRCEAAYRVLRWEDRAASTQFYGALLGSICVLYLLPLCWVLALLNSSLFLGSAEFYQVVLEFKATVEQQLGIRPIESPSPSQPAEIEAGAGAAAPLPDRTPTPTSAEDLTPGSVEEAEEAEPDEEFKDAIEENQLLGLEDDESSQCSVEFDLPDNGFLSKNEVIRSKVSRLTERLRKRCPSNNFGSCTGCAATFSVLKKRRSCSNCGNSFCSRCCSYKVLKSSMGATAPEAQRETVFVCAPCSLALAK